jgi:hypothetical protein
MSVLLLRFLQWLTFCIAEDVLGDLGVRQALRKMPIQVKL